MKIRNPVILDGLQPGFRTSEIRKLQSQMDTVDRIQSGELDGGLN